MSNLIFRFLNKFSTKYHDATNDFVTQISEVLTAKEDPSLELETKNVVTKQHDGSTNFNGLPPKEEPSLDLAATIKPERPIQKEGLLVQPEKIHFEFIPGEKKLCSHLTLHNPTSNRIAFKIKTNNQKRYAAYPSQGFIEPNQTHTVIIYMYVQYDIPNNMHALSDVQNNMHALSNVQNDIYQCKDKFLVMSAPVKTDVTEIQSDTFEKNCVRIVKLVILESRKDTNMQQQYGVMIQPGTVHFDIIQNKQQSAYFFPGTLYNPTNNRLAFMITSNRPSIYRVNHSMGFLDPGESKVVNFYMLASSKHPQKKQNEKYLVQSVPVEKNENIFTPEIFQNERGYFYIVDIFLHQKKCTFLQGLVPQQSTVRFEFIPNKVLRAYTLFYNPTNNRIAFKIKTTDPKRFSVLPRIGTVEPKKFRAVGFYMKAQSQKPIDIDNCTEKFLVQYSVVDKQNQTSARELFENDRLGDENVIKMDVILEALDKSKDTNQQQGQVEDMNWMPKIQQSRASSVDNNIHKKSANQQYNILPINIQNKSLKQQDPLTGSPKSVILQNELSSSDDEVDDEVIQWDEPLIQRQEKNQKLLDGYQTSQIIIQNQKFSDQLETFSQEIEQNLQQKEIIVKNFDKNCQLGFKSQNSDLKFIKNEQNNSNDEFMLIKQGKKLNTRKQKQQKFGGQKYQKLEFGENNSDQEKNLIKKSVSQRSNSTNNIERCQLLGYHENFQDNFSQNYETKNQINNSQKGFQIFRKNDQFRLLKGCETSAPVCKQKQQKIIENGQVYQSDRNTFNYYAVNNNTQKWSLHNNKNIQIDYSKSSRYCNVFIQNKNFR